MLRRPQSRSSQSRVSPVAAGRRPCRVGRTLPAVVESVEPRQMFAVVAEVPSQVYQPGRPQAVFTDIATGNANGSGASAAQAVTLRNTGGAPVSITSAQIVDDAAVAGDHAGQFEPVNWPAAGTLAPGEALTFNVRLRADSTGLKAAVLRVQTSDPSSPTVDVALRGIGTRSESSGEVGGNTEPSLQRILNAFQIPVNVGDANGEDTFDLPTPRPAGTAHDEVEMQRLVKAGPGAVTIEPLAEYAFNAGPGSIGRFGYYTPGTQHDKTELFAVSQTERTSTSPTWGATFDPGASPFGLYGEFHGSIFEINKLPRGVYSEDKFNTWDANNKRKVRFFPLKNPDGSEVPNAFVFAFEEFNAGYDSNDTIGIIRNVRSAGGGPEVGTENMDRAVLFPDRLTFSRIEQQPPTTRDPVTDEVIVLPNNAVHDEATVRIHNSGDQPLTITSATLSNTEDFRINTTGLNGFVIPAGGQKDIEVRFTATTGRIETGTLTLSTNDPDEPTTVVQLTGIFQDRSEREEPTLQEVVQVFGYGTAITNEGQTLFVEGEQGRVSAVGDEVLSPYWRRNDPARAVEALQLAAYHTHGENEKERLNWHYRGSNTITEVFAHGPLEGQSVLPRLNESTTQVAAGTFKPATRNGDVNPAFGFRIREEWSDPTKNIQEKEGGGYGHRVRFWQAEDASGTAIPNTYILAMDYLGINYDYQDNIYLVTNLTPADAPVVPPAAPTGLTATANSAGVFLNWNDNPAGTFAGYDVFRGTSADFTPGAENKLNDARLTASEFSDTTAETGVTQHYKVVAVNSAGAQSGATSASATRPAAEPAPETPAGLSATAASSSAINVSWNASANAARYVLERRGGADAEFRVVASGLTTTSFADSGLTPSTTYEYRVSAANAAGVTSAASAAVSARTLGVDDPPPVPAASVADVTGGETNLNTAVLTFTVTLDKAPTETVSVNYATADGTATAGGDYVAATGILTFAPGETSKTVAVDVVSDSQAEAAETFTLNLTPVGSNVAVADAQGVGTITADDAGGGQTLPFGGRQRATFTGTDGRPVRVSLKGLGSGEVTDLGNGTAIIITVGTDAASSLSITGAPALQGVTVNGALRSLTGKTADLRGNLSVAGTLSRLLLRNATGGRVDVGGAGVPLAVTLGNATDLSLRSASPIKSVRAAQWVDSGGATESITAPLLSSGTVRGDFAADLLVGRLERFTVGGTLSGSDVRSAGDVMSLRAGRMAGSRVFAGVADGQVALPDSMNDFANSAALIRSVSVTSRAAGAFVDTLIAAPQVGSVSLGSIVTGNSGSTFGVSGDAIGTVRGSTATRLSLRGLDDPADSTTEGDFVTRVL